MGHFNNELNHGIVEGWLQELTKFAGSWNGEDETFHYEGQTYTEADAENASELVGLLGRAQDLFRKLPL